LGDIIYIICLPKGDEREFAAFFVGGGMSSSGSGGGQSTSTTQNLPSWAQPYAQQLLQRGADLSNTTTPQYGGQMVAGLSPQQQAGISQTGQVAQGTQGLADTASQYYQQLSGGAGPQVSNPFTGNVTASTIANPFTDPSNNPYLAASVAGANKQITDAYSNVTAPTTLAQFRNAGAFGGTAQDQYTGTQQKQLADALSANTANMYGQAYNTAAGVAQNLSQQQNQVGLANQAVGTQAGQSTQALGSQNYFNNINSILASLQGATGAQGAAGTAAGQQITAGGVTQQNAQDALNAAYQQWYNQVNQPYANLSTLSSSLSGALGSGAGTSMTTQMPGSSNTLGTALGLGQLGLGAYNAYKSS
jgi:hypothetical protein